MTKKLICSKGEVWCPIRKKCKPIEQRPGKGKQFGQGNGPIGNPKQEQKIDNLVDEVFEEGFDKLNQLITIEKQVDNILDKIESKDTVKVKILPTMQGGVDVRITENDIQNILYDLKENKNYKRYFKTKLQKSGYNSISDMPNDVKKKFFISVDRGWKAQNEGIDPIALGMGIAGGMVGIVANRAICNKRFPTVKSRRTQKVAYAKCLRNPFRKSAKKKDEDSGIRENTEGRYNNEIWSKNTPNL